MNFLLLVLIPRIVFAADAPVAMSPTEPDTAHVLEGTVTVVDEKEVISHMTVPEGLYLNKPASQHLRDYLTTVQKENVELTTENEALKAKVDEITSKPNTSFGALLICLVVGVAAGALATFTLKK